MERLYTFGATNLDRCMAVRTAFSKGALYSAVIVLGFCVFPQISSAQTAKPEANAPITIDDIADGVKAALELRQDKAKVKIYCSALDLIEAAEGDAKPNAKPANPKAAEALDAKVEKIIKSLGEDFNDAYFALEDLPDNSPLGSPLRAAFEVLDDSCG